MTESKSIKILKVLVVLAFIVIPLRGFSETERANLFKNHKNYIRQGYICTSCHEMDEKKELIHNSAWIDIHKNVAVRREGECLKCHSREFCADCHSYKQELKPSEKEFNDVKPSFQHRGEWISRHPLEAKADSAKCYRCHTQNFCQECHENRLSGSPHPKGRWQAIHGEEARRNIGSCAACHDEGADTRCIDCHKDVLKPHPSGWSDDHPGLDREKDRPCVYCHKEGH